LQDDDPAAAAADPSAAVAEVSSGRWKGYSLEAEIELPMPELLPLDWGCRMLAGADPAAMASSKN